MKWIILGNTPILDFNAQFCFWLESMANVDVLNFIIDTSIHLGLSILQDFCEVQFAFGFIFDMR
jgi:hypothetical protein